MRSPTTSPARIAIIGTNYVGLVTAACLAELGHTVVGLDIDPLKVAQLQRGRVPFHEPLLQELVVRQLAARRLRFTRDYAEALGAAEVAFLCVGTPASESGAVDLSQVRSAVDGLARHAPPGAHLIVATKSTVPVGTGEWIEQALAVTTLRAGTTFSVVSNPEFLRQGSAVSDFRAPDRVVIGGTDANAVDRVASVYYALRPTPPIVKTDLRTAELVTYASNAFLATRISFINEMALICDEVGADVSRIADAMGLDRRIGPRFLSAGIGYGGSCFSKDVVALAQAAGDANVEPRLLQAVIDINHDMRSVVLERLEGELGDLTERTIGILGLSFKPHTDDLRESPAIAIADHLLARGARVRAYDPAALAAAARQVPDMVLCTDAYAAAEGADALLVLTDWPEFLELDFARVRDSLRRPILIDGRNFFEPTYLRSLGFSYHGIGRGGQGRTPVRTLPVGGLWGAPHRSPGPAPTAA